MAGGGSSQCLDDGKIAAFVAGSLDSTSMLGVEEHLAGCATCRGLAAAGLAHGTEPATSISTRAAGLGLGAPEWALIAERFELRGFIARGGMGVVYRGYDRQTRELVAIKLIRPALSAEHSEQILRFVREGEILQRLNHPNIVKMVAAVKHAGQQVLVLEYVAGGSLRELLRESPRLPLARALSISVELSDALARAHHLGTLHRDVKPENVLLALDGTPRLSDFGLARIGDQRITEDGALLGTVSYLSPEALWGQPLDQRADVWACGVMLFEMLAGHCPFRGERQAAVITNILHQRPADLRALRPDAPPALIELVYRMLEKDRHARIASARQVAAELETITFALEPDLDERGRGDTRLATKHVSAGRGRIGDLIYGRREIVERVQRAWERATRGSGKLFVFSGEAGIGKSYLAQHVVGEAAACGARVAWGRCWEAGGAPAYWPWAQVFRDLGLDDPFATITPQLSTGALEARFAAFDRAVQLLKARASEQPLALVLDDLHVADAPSLSFLQFLARELPRSRILLVAAYRDAEAAFATEIAPLLAKISREAEVYPLSRLAFKDVADWLRASQAQPSSRTAEELYRVTEGHPLIVAEVLRLSSSTFGKDAWRRPQAVLEERLGRLSAETRTALEAAAIWGREFTASDLVATANLPPDHVFQALREARAASIVEPNGASAGFRFCHVLLRDRLYEEIPPSARMALHLEVGRLLVAQNTPRAAIHHLFEGCSGPPRSERAQLEAWVAPVALAAAEAALSHWAFEEALRLGRKALGTFLMSGLHERVRCELYLVVAESLIRLGEIPEGKVFCAQALESAERAGESDLLARAALVRGTELATGRLDGEMVGCLRHALARLPLADSSLRARVLARLATALTPLEKLEDGVEVMELLRAAVEMARRLDDRQALLYVLQFGTHLGTFLPEAERFELVQEALRLARTLGEPLANIQILPSYFTMLAARGEHARAIAELPTYDEVSSSFPQPLHQVRRLIVESLLATLRGDLEHAQRADSAARDIAQRPGAAAAMNAWVAHRFSLAQLLARPDLLLEDAPTLLAHSSRANDRAGVMAWILAALGRTREAMEQLTEVPQAHPWSLGLMVGGEACVMLREVELGRKVYASLERASDRMFFAGAPGLVFGPTSRTLGNLALLLGRPRDALHHYEDALASCERLEFPILIEQCRRARDTALTWEGMDTARLSARPPGAAT